MAWFRENCILITDEIAGALTKVDEDEVNRLVETIDGAGKVFVVGVGRVLLSLQAMAKRFNHLGVRTWFVGEINEPAISPDDVLIVASGSGESAVPLAIARIAYSHGATVAHIGSNPSSSMSKYSRIFVRIPVATKLGLAGELPSRQIMSSLFEQCLLVLGDALALRIAQLRGIADLGSLKGNHANLE